MERKHIKDLKLELNGENFELGFDIDSVKAFGNYSLSHNGKLGDEDLIKYALQKNHKDELNPTKKARNIQEALAQLGEDDDMTYMDVMQRLIMLYMQAIDDVAEQLEPASIVIEKDNSVTVIYNGEKYKLTFNRSDIKDALINSDTVFSFNNPLELYTVGSSLLKLATKHYNKRFSVKFHDNLFLALWATKFNKETEDTLPEVINALSFHIGEVLNSGVKNSKAAIKIVMEE